MIRVLKYLRYLFVAFILISALTVHAGVVTSKHNLSVNGPGTVKAAADDRVCIFCHTAHTSSPIAPLWNRRNPGAVYTTYSSSTVVSLPGQPNGSSLICLSCHDGTIALGDVLVGGPITMAGGVTSMPVGRSLIGTDLSDDHPISFQYTSALAATRGELADPASLTGAVKLDSSGQLQCTSCHDPHNDVFGKFLVVDNRGSTLCETCHLKANWTASPHNTSGNTWNGVAPDPWPNSNYTTVADNGCGNCHTPHAAGQSQRLLNSAAEEQTCFNCHNGNVTGNIQADFNKASHHPVEMTNGIHDPNEATIVTNRHVECVDCHNPHSAGTGPGTPGISGVDYLGNIVNPITATYQVCFRCHGDSPNIPAPRTTRQVVQPNIRLQFDTINPSFHPVAGIGKSTNVPSLIAPWTTTSMMECTDCHGDDGGSNRPHGSIYSPILKMQNITTDPNAESPAAYALCYSCHDRNSILSDNTFGEHRKHIQGENAPCNTCHDPHGVSLAAGATTANNARLINFNTNVVSPSGGVLAWTSNGLNSGSCTLVCHGENHNPETYGGGGGGGGGGTATTTTTTTTGTTTTGGDESDD